MADERMTAVEFVRKGYEVRPSENGGFLVCDGDRYSGNIGRLAAFTNSTDFLAWLSAGHAIYDKELVK